VEGASRTSASALRRRLDELCALPPSGALAGAAGAGAAGAGAPPAAAVTDPTALAAELDAVVALLRREPSLSRALADPTTPEQARADLVTRLFGSRVAPAALELLGQAARSRWSRPLDLTLALADLGVESLLAQAERDNALDDVEDELFRFGRVVDQNAALALALTDPAATPAVKQRLVERLLAGKAHPVTTALAQRAVAEYQRGDISRRIERLSAAAAARRDRVVGVVTTAVPLDADQLARLRVAVSRYFGREVQLQVDVDPSVLGGVRVRVGEEIVDGSVARRLAAARTRLA
jgi:F-type H+-transporting ATPase subunit delta